MSKKWLFFDCFGVMLDEPYRGWRDTTGLSETQIKALEKEIIDWVDLNAITKEEALEKIKQITKMPTQQFLEETWAYASRVNLELARWIKENKSQYHIAILSNSSLLYLQPLLERTGIENLFERLFLSAEMGVAKPDRQIYLQALQECQCAPENAIMIDDREINVQAARSVGIHGIIFHNAQDAIAQINEIFKKEDQ